MSKRGLSELRREATEFIRGGGSAPGVHKSCRRDCLACAQRIDAHYASILRDCGATAQSYNSMSALNVVCEYTYVKEERSSGAGSLITPERLARTAAASKRAYADNRRA